jgi:isopentenyl-diphosphate delta-isomerase
MRKVTLTKERKADHIRINLDEDTQSRLSNGLGNYRFIHQAVPEINLTDIDPSTHLFQKKLRFPLLISSMTGGTDDASVINKRLAEAAQETGIAMGVGSQRVAIEDPGLEHTFQIRKFAPDIPLFANLGAIQLNYGYGVKECMRAVDMIEADGLILHFNSLQEAVQPNGNTNFANLLEKIEFVCDRLTVPVIAKEVGWGFSRKAAGDLINAGISAIDVAGAGGTSWSQVEIYRSENPTHAKLASLFIDWGIPTAEAILNVRDSDPNLPIIASGGLRSGLDIAKCIALGAILGGMASPFLKAAVSSTQKTIQTIQEIANEIIVTMFAVGAGTLDELRNTKIFETIK